MAGSTRETSSAGEARGEDVARYFVKTGEDEWSLLKSMKRSASGTWHFVVYLGSKSNRYKVEGIIKDVDNEKDALDLLAVFCKTVANVEDLAQYLFAKGSYFDVSLNGFDGSVTFFEKRTKKVLKKFPTPLHEYVRKDLPKVRLGKADMRRVQEVMKPPSLEGG